jgi:hypothetical protein
MEGTMRSKLFICFALILLSIPCLSHASSFADSFAGIEIGDAIRFEIVTQDTDGTYVGDRKLVDFLFAMISEDSVKFVLSGPVFDQPLYAPRYSRGQFQIIVQKHVPVRVDSCSDRFKQCFWLDSIIYNYDSISAKLSPCYPMLPAGEKYNKGDFFRLNLSHPSFTSFGVWLTADSNEIFNGSFGGSNGVVSFGTYPIVGIDSYFPDHSWSINPFRFFYLKGLIDSDYVYRCYLNFGLTAPVKKAYAYLRFGGFFDRTTTKIKSPGVKPRLNLNKSKGNIYYNLRGQSLRAEKTLRSPMIVAAANSKKIVFNQPQRR